MKRYPRLNFLLMEGGNLYAVSGEIIVSGVWGNWKSGFAALLLLIGLLPIRRTWYGYKLRACSLYREFRKFGKSLENWDLSPPAHQKLLLNQSIEHHSVAIYTVLGHSRTIYLMPSKTPIPFLDPSWLLVEIRRPQSRAAGNFSNTLLVASGDLRFIKPIFK